MGKKAAILISAALFTVYALFLAFSAGGFMPREGLRAVAAPAASAALLTGGDDGSHISKELLPQEQININTADAAQLQRLPGIGEALAAAIVAHRGANGAFAAIEDIMKVDGIGQGRFDAIKDKITVEEGTYENSGG